MVYSSERERERERERDKNVFFFFFYTYRLAVREYVPACWPNFLLAAYTIEYEYEYECL